MKTLRRSFKSALLCVLMLSTFAAPMVVLAPTPVVAAQPQQVHFYDAEAQIGLVPNNASPGVAAANTARLNLALSAMWSGGKYFFIDRPAGPVLLPIGFSGKAFYFKGTIITSARIGGSLIGTGRGYEMSEVGYAADSFYGGLTTRLIRIDGETGGPFIRLCGAGFTLEGFELWGRRLILGGAGAGVGTRTQSLIEVEGRSFPANSGRHVLRNLSLNEAQYGIRALAGYYDTNGVFQAHENHADNTLVQNIETFGIINSVFRSENGQAVSWRFDTVRVNDFGYGEEPIVFDIVRGGNLIADHVQLNLGKVTVLKVTDPLAPNANRYDIHLAYWDHDGSSSNYLTLFKFAGADTADASGYKWCVRMTGHINNPSSSYLSNKLVEISSGAVNFPKNDLLFDITNMPLTNFTVVGGGPFYHPN
jgi:hypothetical protein